MCRDAPASPPPAAEEKAIEEKKVEEKTDDMNVIRVPASGNKAPGSWADTRAKSLAASARNDAANQSPENTGGVPHCHVHTRTCRHFAL